MQPPKKMTLKVTKFVVPRDSKRDFSRPWTHYPNDLF